MLQWIFCLEKYQKWKLICLLWKCYVFKREEYARKPGEVIVKQVSRAESVEVVNTVSGVVCTFMTHWNQKNWYWLLSYRLI